MILKPVQFAMRDSLLKVGGCAGLLLRSFRLWMAICIAFAVQSGAQVVLKPHGGPAARLRPTAMDAVVSIEGQFARTRLKLTYQNESSERIEADFIYTLPPNTLVTSFAYWYGDEKVPARVVEKEEAAAIYSHITTRMRDPALVEMIGKRTFRARIFPVMPNSDLKVEMTFAHVLRSDSNGYHFQFPMRAAKGETLNSIHVAAKVHSQSGIQRVTNENSLPVTADRQVYSMVYSGSNIRPQRDLIIHVQRKPQPLFLSSTAGRTSHNTAFFALALTPDRNITNASVELSGIAVQSILKSIPNRLAAGKSYMIYGKYRGGGRLSVRLTGADAGKQVALMSEVKLPTEGSGADTASYLWSNRQMEVWSARPGHRSAVIALSKRIGMPSRYTSWLAVPREEMERYEREIAVAKIEVLAKRLAVEIERGRGDASLAKRLRAQLKPLCARLGESIESALSNALYDSVRSAGDRLAKMYSAGNENSRVAHMLSRKLDLLCRVTGQRRTDILEQSMYEATTKVAGAIAIEIKKHHENSTKNRVLRRRLDYLCRISATSSADAISRSLNTELYDLADKIVSARHSEHPNREAIARNLAVFRRLERAIGKSQQDWLIQSESQWTYDESHRIHDTLAAEYLSGQPNGKKADELAKRFIELHIYNRDYATSQVQRLKIRGEHSRLLRRRVSAETTDPSELANIDDRLKVLEKREEELRARMGDPLISVAAPQNTRQVIAVMPSGEIKNLVFNPTTGHWEARFDIPVYASEGEYVITVILISNDYVRSKQTIRYHVDLTAPIASGSARLAQGENRTIRLEMDAGEDAARVKAVLPWGDVVELRRGAKPHHFFALASVRAGYDGRNGVITYVVTDRAHNKTSVTVDLDR